MPRFCFPIASHVQQKSVRRLEPEKIMQCDVLHHFRVAHAAGFAKQWWDNSLP
jgi:hypothetical protein